MILTLYLHLRQGPLELLAVLVIALGEGHHPLIVSSLPAAFAVLGEPRPYKMKFDAFLLNLIFLIICELDPVPCT